jgi:hypothetical protein
MEHTCKSARTGPPSNLMKWSQQKRSNRTSFWNEKKKVHFPCLIARRQQSHSFLNQCFQEEMRSFLLPFFTSTYRVAICSSTLLPWSTLSQCWLVLSCIIYLPFSNAFFS